MATHDYQHIEKSEIQHSQLGSDLKERVKELECLYGISGFLNKLESNRDKAFREILSLVRAAFKYPAYTGVQITLYQKTYRTGNYHSTQWKISRSISIGKKQIGKLEVRYFGKYKRKSPFLKEEGKLLTAVARRIGTATERFELAARLKNSERFYRSLFSNANDGIFLHYPDGKIGMVNKAMSRISGYSQKELLNMRVTDFLLYESSGESPQISSDELSYKYKQQRRQIKMKLKSGDIRFVEVTNNRLADAERMIVTQTIVRDVTEEKQQKESIHAYAGQVINAQENERKRIARELHDETIQALVSLGMDIDAITRTEHRISPELGKRLKELRNRAKTIGDGVKNLTRALRPPMLDDVGLLTALRWLVTEVSRLWGIESQLEVIGENRRLTPETEVTIYRIAQEALNNIVKHSGASKARVSLQFGKTTLKLAISDDGHGYDPTQASKGSLLSNKMGMIGMEERTRLLNGTLRFDSTEKGTKVFLEVPLS